MAEIVEGLLYAFRELGCETDVARNEIIPDGINILFFSFYVADINSIPPNSILFNAEQIDQSSRLLTNAYFEQLERFTVWDYSRRNIERIVARLPQAQVQHLPIGFAPNLSRIVRSESQDIDILFYGALNDRRSNILRELERCGCLVVHTDNTYGEARDQLIARSKLVLNLHFYDAKIFEIVRVAYLLCNEVAVVSECDEGTEIDEDLRGAVVGVPYSEIVKTCLDLLSDASRRHLLAKRGREIFQRRDQAGLLRGVIATSKFALPLPRQINIGSGRSWHREFLNIDINPVWNPDVIFDASSLELFSTEFNLDRFGSHKLPESYFSKIIAIDVLGHVQDLVGLMSNVLRLLTEGGDLHIRVPYDLSYSVWQDPSQLRAFNEKSWLFYTDWFWHIGWTTHRFDIEFLEFDMSDYGRSLVEAEVSHEDILRTPRAVDCMRVCLRKRALTPDERIFGNKMLQING
jgi:hypothetical protein